MTTLIPCYLTPRAASELKRLAVIAGSESDAVERLIEFWTANHGNVHRREPERPIATHTQQVWRSSSGDELPVGARLEAPYKGQTFYATVEKGGIRFGKALFQSPSAAGRAVKDSVGVHGKAGQTDGRAFWRLRDPNTGLLVAIGELIPRKQIDGDALLKAFMSKQ